MSPGFQELQNRFTTANGKRLLLFAAVAVFLTILAPFGSDALSPLWLRTVYWFTLIFLGAGISIGISNVWHRYLEIDEPRILSLSTAGQILVVSVLIACMVIAVGWIVGIPPTFYEWIALFFNVVVITVAVTVITHLLDTSHTLQHALEEAERKAEDIYQRHNNQEGNTPPATFAERLPHPLRTGELISLSSEDHYLLVTTSTGKDHIRCTMAEAADELASLDGRVIHRSHWITHKAIDHLERSSGRTFVILTDGQRLPVSRSRLTHLQQEGWLPPVRTATTRTTPDYE